MLSGTPPPVLPLDTAPSADAPRCCAPRQAAKQVKEKYSYVCSDMNKELAKHESDPAKYSRTHTMWNAKAGQVKQPGRQGA